MRTLGSGQDAGTTGTVGLASGVGVQGGVGRTRGPLVGEIVGVGGRGVSVGVERTIGPSGVLLPTTIPKLGARYRSTKATRLTINSTPTMVKMARYARPVATSFSMVKREAPLSLFARWIT